MVLKRLLAAALILASHMGILPEAKTESRQERRPVKIILPSLYEESVRPLSVYEALLAEGEESPEEEALLSEEEREEEPEGVEEVPAEEDDGMSFYPYVFTVDEVTGVSASVELQPNLMVIGDEESDAEETSSVMAAIVEDPDPSLTDEAEEEEPQNTDVSGESEAEAAIPPADGNATVIVTNTTAVINSTGEVTPGESSQTVNPPVVTSGSYTYNSTATIVFRTEDIDSSEFEFNAYTTNSEVIKSIIREKPLIVDGKEYYQFAIGTYVLGKDGVEVSSVNTTAGKMQIVTISGDLYYAENEVPAAGSTIYFSAQTRNSEESALYPVKVEGDSEPETLDPPVVESASFNDACDASVVFVTGDADSSAFDIVAYTKKDLKGHQITTRVENGTTYYCFVMMTYAPFMTENVTIEDIPDSSLKRVTLKGNVDCVTGAEPKAGDVIYMTALTDGSGQGNLVPVTVQKNGSQEVTPINSNNIAVEFHDPALNKTKTTVYNGEWQTPEIMVYKKDTGLKLIEGVDYKVKYGSNTNAGKGNATVIGIGNYDKEKTITFTINKAQLLSNNTVIQLDQDQYTYTGEAIKPVETVIYNTGTANITLTKDTDYTVSYKDNKKIGTAKLTAAGKGNFEKSVSTTFPIVEKEPVSIKDAKIDIVPRTYTYSGKENKPNVYVILDGKELTKGTDYTVIYSDNINAGKVLVTVKGKGDYTDNATDVFLIEPLTVDEETLQVTFNPVNNTYTGKEIEPAVTAVLKSSGKKLASGTDYDLLYTENINVGKGSATVVTKGNFIGNVTGAFFINPASLAKDTQVLLDPDTFSYSGEPNEPQVMVSHNQITLIEGRDYTIVYLNNTEVGTGKVLVSGLNNYDKETSQTFVIEKAKLQENNTSITLDQDSYVYTGEKIIPAETVVYNTGSKNMTLEKGRDYEVKVIDNVEVGTGILTVTGKGNFIQALDKTFEIVAPDPISLSVNTTVEVDPENETYTGEEIEPSVTVICNGKTLRRDKDYVLVFENNVDAGKASVTVVGKGQYVDNATAVFTINPAEANTETLETSLDPQNASYTGSEITPAVTIVMKKGGKTLSEGSDYDLKFSDNVNAGTASVTIVTKGNFSGNMTESFQIDPAHLSENTVVTLEPEEFVYSGNPSIPSVTVTHNGVTLEKDRDYTVQFLDNTEVGEAKAVVRGTGNYDKNMTAVFRIVAGSLSEDTTMELAYDVAPYTGEAHEPDAKVICNGKVLKAGTDYTLIYENNTNAGTARVTAVGKGNYGGNCTAELQILPFEINEDNTEITYTPEVSTYTGNPLTPEVRVEVEPYSYDMSVGSGALENSGELPEGGWVLEPGVDYDVEFTNNINAGNGDTTITAKGNYVGTVHDQFVIEPASLSENTEVVLTPETFIYSGNPNEPSAEVTRNGTTLVSGQDYSVRFENNTDVGTAKAIVNGTGNYKDEAEAEFAIKAGDVSEDTTIVIDNVVYSGEEQTPSINVTCNGNELKEGEDFEAEYSDNTDAGTAKVKITGKGDYIGNTTAEFTIDPLPVDSDEVEIVLGNDTVLYTGEPIEVPVTVTFKDNELKEGEDYEVTYENNTEVGTAKAVVKGKGNYNSTAEKEFTIREPEKYNVQFDANGGSGSMNMTAVEGEPFELPECPFDAPDKTQEFDTWDAGDPGETIEVTEDMTVKALWKEKIYPVTKGGNQTVTKGKEAVIEIESGEDECNGTILIDGKPAEKGDVEVEESGNKTTVRLTKDFIKSLPTGKHDIEVDFINGGKAKTSITVKKSSGGSDDSNDSRYIPPYNPYASAAGSRVSSPNTADHFSALFWSFAFLAGLLGTCMSVHVLKKKRF